MEMEHGGDILGASHLSGIAPDMLLDFSVNVTPLGIPEKIKTAMYESLGQAGLYPDLSKRRLNQAIGRKHHIPESWVCCGNGASDLIFRLVFALKPKKALILAPTFVEYASALCCVTGDIERYRVDHKDFMVREDILDRITERTDLVILCNPNNPTGQLIPRDLMIKIAGKCALTHTLLLIDECFLEFAENGKDYSMEKFLPAYPGMVILKSFTKMFGIAGLRLGYMLCSDSDLCRMADRFGCDWNVNCVAEAAGLAALECDDYVEKVVACVSKERAFLITSLESLGISVVHGKANYLLFRVPGEERLYEKLLAKGIMIRTCSNYDNLGRDYYRIGIRTPEDDRYLVRSLDEILRPEEADRKEMDA
ncbi:MAG TPA: aminotransferase class I/II-fold pyridoxal phosphate-dependent enzyme [Candidatus Onthocola gallistercoris]|uniref:Aminotransferase n=1 Tax=Candidatus Onthocola gallistercoris TaxID=2840876 RepID=A0A9D1HEX9_9FIRM|nr:aminotransferase class I/II-fold pyridoxal phosphate-dependent enzyme [Candidatus Onthocola gallistercoris]